VAKKVKRHTRSAVGQTGVSVRRDRNTSIHGTAIEADKFQGGFRVENCQQNLALFRDCNIDLDQCK
jgi:hypothetical protein